MSTLRLSACRHGLPAQSLNPRPRTWLEDLPRISVRVYSDETLRGRVRFVGPAQIFGFAPRGPAQRPNSTPVKLTGLSITGRSLRWRLVGAAKRSACQGGFRAHPFLGSALGWFYQQQQLTMESGDQQCPPVVVIGGTSSGVGKTSLSVGLMAALRRVPLDTESHLREGLKRQWRDQSNGPPGVNEC
jgi:hypothetical protein